MTRRRSALTLPALVLLASVPLAATGCVGRRIHLTWTEDLARRPGADAAELAAGDPLSSELLITSLLLGRDVTTVSAGDLPLDTVRLEELFASPPGEPGDLLAYRLLHVTDVQLRNRAIGFRPRLERRADRHVRWTINNWFQDHADVVYLMLSLRAMRAMLDRGSHAVVVHTGDAVHIDHPTEVEAFAVALERALLFDPDDGSPCRSCWADHGWLTPLSRAAGDDAPTHRFVNVLGNHDVLRWGAWSRDGQALLRAYPDEIASRADLCRALATIGGGDGALTGDGARPDRGYTTVDIPIPGAPPGAGSTLRLVVLDTNETNPPGRLGERDSRPAVSPAQRDWLIETLEAAGRDGAVDHVIVLGHVPLWRVRVCDEGGPCGDAGALEDALRAQPKVIAYLSGHWHSGVSPDSPYLRSRHYPFAHLTMPSMMEFPKILTSITVRKRADGSYAVDTDPMDLADLGLLPREPGPEAASVDVRQDVTGRDDAVLAAWLRALDARCGEDLSCRALQVAADGMAGARADRPGTARLWLGRRGPAFHAHIIVDR